MKRWRREIALKGGDGVGSEEGKRKWGANKGGDGYSG